MIDSQIFWENPSAETRKQEKSPGISIKSNGRSSSSTYLKKKKRDENKFLCIKPTYGGDTRVHYHTYTPTKFLKNDGYKL